MAELLANTGLDFLLIDMEHAPHSPGLLQNLLMGLNGTECASLVRVPWNEPWIIKQVIDVGADAIMVPMVNNREEAVKAAAATKYPPAGIRGVGPRRASMYGLDEAYMDRANDEIGVVVQIEHIDAVKRTEEIATAPGVDCVYVGPADLTGSLGKLPDFGNADTRAAIDEVIETCTRIKRPFAIYSDSAEGAARWANRGGQLQTIGEDFMMLGAANVAALKEARSLLK
jgi:4-hydroxy-2-oxoheptanedioate aldolase